jgi:hypothetical protein
VGNGCRSVAGVWQQATLVIGAWHLSNVLASLKDLRTLTTTACGPMMHLSISLMLLLSVLDSQGGRPARGHVVAATAGSPRASGVG